MKGVLRIVRDGQVKLTLPCPSVSIKANGTIWFQGMPVLGAPPEKKSEMAKLVKEGKYNEIPIEYYTHLGNNANGLWAGDDESWNTHPAKLTEDIKNAAKALEDKKIVKIYLSSRGWGDYSPLNWTGDITRPDADILAECKDLLINGCDVDKRNQSTTDILKLIQEARTKWATPTQPEKEIVHGSGYCFSCETYCDGDCGDYQSKITSKIKMAKLQHAITEDNYGIDD